MELPLEAITQHWPLTRLEAGQVLQRYDSRIVVILKAAEGTFVAKMMTSEEALGLVEPSDQQIDELLQIFDYLAKHEYEHAPALLKTRSGECYARIGDHVIYIMEYIEGSRPTPSPATFAALGRLAARLNTFMDFPYEYPIAVMGVIGELTEWAEQYPFRDAIVEQVEKLAALADQPVSLIHTELNCANSIQRPDGSLVIVDWDAVGTGPTVLEAGYPLLTVFLTEELVFHDDWARAFYTAYTAGAGMSDEQKEMLFTAALLHALRSMTFYNPLQRWQRIVYAVEHKDMLLSVIPAAAQ